MGGATAVTAPSLVGSDEERSPPRLAAVAPPKGGGTEKQRRHRHWSGRRLCWASWDPLEAAAVSAELLASTAGTVSEVQGGASDRDPEAANQTVSLFLTACQLVLTLFFEVRFKNKSFLFPFDDVLRCTRP